MSYKFEECFPKEYWRMESEFMHMYPGIYHEMYPYICGVIDEMDDPCKYPVPPRCVINDMTDECMRRMSCLNIDMDADKNESKDDTESMQFGRRGLLRSLVAVILIGELLRRRRRIFF
jgi:hypothetical protein